MSRDIAERKDIEFLVEQFYERLLVDEIVGHFFNEVVKLDLDEHLPIICDFWESLLYDTAIYQGNPMIKHIALHEKSPILNEHFERWLHIWKDTVQSHFRGEFAEKALLKADQIALLMKIKVRESNNPRLIL